MLALWPVSTSLAPLIVFVVINGMGNGGFFAIMPTVVGNVFGSARVSVSMGMIVTGWTGGYLLGAPIAGYILDAYGGEKGGFESYRPAMFYAGSMALGAAGLVVYMRLAMDMLDQCFCWHCSWSWDKGQLGSRLELALWWNNMPALQDNNDLNEQPFRAKQAPEKQVQVLKQKVRDAKAQVGWLQAHHAKEIRALSVTLDRHGREQLRLKAELTSLRSQASRLEADNAKLRGESNRLQAQLQQHDQGLERLREFETQVRHTMLQIDMRRPLSLMEAAVHNEVPSENLLERGRICWAGIEKSHARMRQTHCMKLLAMRRDIHVEQQRFHELS
ncbi:hypothetical protein LTR70_010727 [Exophiala xenobiotica]|uniref:Major facilitator superfamily (MFS) profile domain-containing protein n=1 Tax=Lithohypha guttulata TaxID=1690604 RepID=A0ABR0JTF0_9EURO|nr:hypothetical protein LTR24_010712 [Lithohypha guttulata]KAK5308930.1 hypothetical protein LTR70_010727 [Exophiala xenobiotica]